MSVLAKLGPEVALIVVVDDACPKRTADLVKRENADPRVSILRLQMNVGVGGLDTDDQSSWVPPSSLSLMVMIPAISLRDRAVESNIAYDLNLPIFSAKSAP
jgi:hypothetical protein